VSEILTGFHLEGPGLKMNAGCLIDLGL